MYDLIVVRRKLNIKKVICTIAVLLFLVITFTLFGINLGEKAYTNKYVKQLLNQTNKIEQSINDKKAAEQKAIQDEINLRIEKTCKPLNDNQKHDIVHVYNSNGEKRVFLTFDDGPTKTVTPFVLDTLKQANVKATFFLLGTNVEINPDLVKREFNEGHYIGNHGYSHVYSKVYETPESTIGEYNQTEADIRNALGNQSFRCNVFRFPGGSNGGFYNDKKQASKELLSQNGIAHLDWNALSGDAEGKFTKEQLLENAKTSIGNKDSVVILMHDSSDKILTNEMLPDLINYLKQQGYSFKTIYDLL